MRPATVWYVGLAVKHVLDVYVVRDPAIRVYQQLALLVRTVYYCDTRACSIYLRYWKGGVECRITRRRRPSMTALGRSRIP